MSMATWKAKTFNKTTSESQTPGKTKSSRCQADYMDKFFAKRSRSYKHPGYSDWLRRKNGY